MSNPNLRICGGTDHETSLTTSTQGTGASSERWNIYTQGTNNPSMSGFVPPSGGAGEPPEGSNSVTLGRLDERIKGAFIWLGLLTVGMAGALIFLLNTISQSFDKLDSPLNSISSTQAAHGTMLSSIDKRLDKIDTQLENHRNRVQPEK